jgi:hypothetical protein
MMEAAKVALARAGGDRTKLLAGGDRTKLLRDVCGSSAVPRHWRYGPVFATRSVTVSVTSRSMPPSWRKRRRRHRKAVRGSFPPLARASLS